MLMNLSPNRDRPARRWMAQLLTLLLSLPPALVAQQTSGPEQTKPAPLPTVRSLKVVPLAGGQEMNDLERRVMAPLVVQVLDQNENPIEGAEVVFRFPPTGPSAVFANQQNAQTVKANSYGQAAAIGWTANNQVGSFRVHVTASRGNEIGEATIPMTNVTRITAEETDKRRSWWSSKWAKIAVIAAAAGVAAAVGLSKWGKSGGTATITAHPGSPTIGGTP